MDEASVDEHNVEKEAKGDRTCLGEVTHHNHV
eukprot:SAG11_NODE_590_length_8314_cov_44.934388_5_plen_32_part_00